MDNKISVVINTYNAERYLEHVLRAASGYDEIVVCDMESTDRTVAIAESFGCKIVTFPKANHVSAEPARNFAIQSASNPWVLVVDADEIVSPQLREYLYERIASPDCPAGIYVPRKNYVLNRFARSSYPDYQLRFFKREGSDWPPNVHTFPSVDGRTEKIPSSHEELAIVHLSDSIYMQLNKLNLYTENEIVKRKGTRVTIVGIFVRCTFRFFKSYILNGGFFLGMTGLVHAVNTANYKFYTLAKIWEDDNLRREGKD